MVKVVGVIALGIDARRVVTLAEADRPEVKMNTVGDPVIYWDADIVDRELAQTVRFARACADLGLPIDDGVEDC